ASKLKLGHDLRAALAQPLIRGDNPGADEIVSNRDRGGDVPRFARSMDLADAARAPRSGAVRLTERIGWTSGGYFSMPSPIIRPEEARNLDGVSYVLVLDDCLAWMDRRE